jgi:drug/metabolite transporter (DMT)-like permease
MVLAAALWLALPVLILDRPWALPAPGAGPFAAVAAMAVVSTAGAYLLYFRLLADAGPVNLLTVTFLIPVGATAMGIAFLGETAAPAQLAGFVLIAAGLVLVTRARRG